MCHGACTVCYDTMALISAFNEMIPSLMQDALKCLAGRAGLHGGMAVGVNHADMGTCDWLSVWLGG